MRVLSAVLAAASVLLFAVPALASGDHTCDSGSQENWQSQETLQNKLTEQGWEVRKIEEDGGCWEVYAIDADGNNVEAYFDPLTLENIYIETR